MVRKRAEGLSRWDTEQEEGLAVCSPPPSKEPSDYCEVSMTQTENNQSAETDPGLTHGVRISREGFTTVTLTVFHRTTELSTEKARKNVTYPVF